MGGGGEQGRVWEGKCTVMVMGVKRPTAVNIRAIAYANACHTLSICRCTPATRLGLEVWSLGFELVIGGKWFRVWILDFDFWCLVFIVWKLVFGSCALWCGLCDFRFVILVFRFWECWRDRGASSNRIKLNVRCLLLLVQYSHPVGPHGGLPPFH